MEGDISQMYQSALSLLDTMSDAHDLKEEINLAHGFWVSVHGSTPQQTHPGWPAWWNEALQLMAPRRQSTDTVPKDLGPNVDPRVTLHDTHPEECFTVPRSGLQASSVDIIELDHHSKDTRSIHQEDTGFLNVHGPNQSCKWCKFCVTGTKGK